MKKNILPLLTACLLLLPMSANVMTKELERLPAKAKELIDTHFKHEKVSYIKINEEILTTTYEVVFISGTEIEFTESGIWKEIDCRRSEVPAGLVPEKIASYVRQHFGGAFITQISKDGKYYEVELSNRLELYFNKNYDFVGFDD